ncbi:CvpA family protein [Filimonas effusa]|uniref:CvpA family protein n=1 Tax=Filimonas effusa TaxID=2508721 RepID=A0A4Q1D1J5_9BACT|nr:CvpA family protein [Filimonas effusa]RXK80875.1 CvpA family protein [Filimonas effusa]
MFIDIIFILLVVLAIIKGLRKGLIVALFSFLAIITGIAAALKLSATVAVWLHDHTNMGTRWLPFLSFLIVMVAVVLIVRWVAALIEAGMEMVLMGWINKLGGVVLYLVLYITIFSVLLFYAAQMGLFKAETISESKSYTFVAPWGPKAIDAMAVVIPFLKNVFDQLQVFFAAFAKAA